MPEETESWEKYGFPDPGLMPLSIPLTGLIKAVLERCHVANVGTPLSVPDTFAMANEKDIMYLIDNALYDLSSLKFWNLDKMQNPPSHESTESSQFYYTWEELLLAGADGHEDEIVICAPYDSPSYNRQRLRFLPELSLKWIKQRYKMVNLLRYRLYGWSCPCEEFYGYKHTWDPDDTYLSYYLASINNLEPHGTVNFPVSLWGTSNRDVHTIRQCKTSIPEQLSGGSDSYLIAFMTGPGNNPDNFGLNGDVIQYGWNFWKTDENGVFFDYDIRQLPIPPDLSHDVGWVPYNGDARQVYDCNQQFYFKEEEPDT